MGKLQYAAHALAWTTSWSNDTLHLIDHVKELGFDYIEIPLLELEKVDPPKIRERLDRVGLGVCVSTACSEETDVSADDAEIRKRGVEYLKQCVHAAHEIGAACFSGVFYSAIGKKLIALMEKRDKDLSQHVNDSEKRAEQLEKASAQFIKESQRLQDIGLSIEELTEFTQRIRSIARHHKIKPANFRERLLNELENLDKGIGLETLIENRKRIAGL